MPLESGTLIPDLDANNPLGSDPKSEGDDHLRLIKRTVLGSFPAFVGTTAVPKTVALTEDQINDAALKSEAATISGAWEHTVPLLLANDIPLQARFSSGPATDIVKMSSVDRLTFGSAGHHTDFFAATGANAYRYFVGGVEVSRGGTLADGGLLVSDLDGFFKAVGFRHITRRTLAVDSDVLQEWEGQAIQITGGNPLISGAVLLAGTSVRLWSTSGTWTLLPGALANFRWLNGDGGLNNIPNGILVQQNGIVELFHATTATAYVFGNGISAI